MSDTFACSSCGKSYRWKAELAGRKVRCKCGAVLAVPESVEAEAEAYELSLDDAAATSSAAAHPPTSVAEASRTCGKCGGAVSASAVICLHCGFNLATGQAIETAVGGRAVKAADRNAHRRQRYDGYVDGFFGRLRRSWEFAKLSYSILWDFKFLLLFPCFSMIAALFVLVSFIAPLWGTGTLEQLDAFFEEQGASENSPLVYAIAFAFYFCNFFVIVFFNTALAACTIKVCAGETPTLGYGLSIAMKRLPQIVGWALVSATVGLLLKLVENNFEKVGRIIAAVMGAAWTVLTFFVVPVLAVEGVGPIKAVGRSVSTMKETWGESIMGNFAIGWINVLLALPLLLIFGVMVFYGITSESLPLTIVGVMLFVATLILVSIVGSAADVVFRSLLYNYATGRTIPEEVDEEMFAAAFASGRDGE